MQVLSNGQQIKHEQYGLGVVTESDAEHTDGRNEPSTPGLVWSAPQKGLGFVYIDAGPYRITRQNKKYDCHRDAYYLGSCDNAEAAKQLCADHLAAREKAP